ncbi:MAG: GAF domain-containing protein [Candidatus Faecousia sp.]|nr:GAF domain-containing protein [Clostridiales bacterium]MDY2809365.1 GAF domain-containing protein [Candidatus Faecousia sp.]
METFRSGSSIVIRDLEDVRETSPSEYALLKPQDIRREIASPIFYKGSLGGFLGLDNPGIEDTKSLVELLQLVGSHFGSSLENTRMVTALKRSVEDLRREQQILSVLCEDDTAVYRADLLNDRASVVKMSRNSNIYEIQIRNRGEDLPYTAFLQEYCADYVVPEDRERLPRELLPENLRLIVST